jgi:hypothetical protein
MTNDGNRRLDLVVEFEEEMPLPTDVRFNEWLGDSKSLNSH